MIGSSLESKVLLYIPNVEQRHLLQQLNPEAGNGVDELRYLFLSSQVELLDSLEALQDVQYKMQGDNLSVGIVKADGEKCDRCWNYSTQVGKFAEHPIICERCVAALSDRF